MSENNSWSGIKSLAKLYGAKFPEVVAAQWALESGWGKHPNEGHNYFGLKSKSGGYKKFDSLEKCVHYLVSRWYLDYEGFKGINRAATRDECATLLREEGYAEDPNYSKKLIAIMEKAEPPAKPEDKKQVTDNSSKIKQAIKSVTGVFNTRVKTVNISQPDAVTCQSACIAMALGGSKTTQEIRRELNDVARIRRSIAGDPYVMQVVLKRYKKQLYTFDDNASLSEVREWLRNGEFLITHGWFTGSGHVICLDGVSIDQSNLSYKLNVKDPWSEFFAKTWSYGGSSNFYDGYYSSYCIYAACVKGTSRNNAAAIYRRGELDSSRKGAWIHRIMPG